MADKPSTIVAAVLISIIGGFPLFTLPIVGPVLQEQLGFTIQRTDYGKRRYPTRHRGLRIARRRAQQPPRVRPR